MIGNFQKEGQLREWRSQEGVGETGSYSPEVLEMHNVKLYRTYDCRIPWTSASFRDLGDGEVESGGLKGLPVRREGLMKIARIRTQENDELGRLPQNH